jgi:hypothetical protein
LDTFKKHIVDKSTFSQLVENSVLLKTCMGKPLDMPNQLNVIEFSTQKIYMLVGMPNNI